MGRSGSLMRLLFEGIYSRAQSQFVSERFIPSKPPIHDVTCGSVLAPTVALARQLSSNTGGAEIQIGGRRPSIFQGAIKNTYTFLRLLYAM